MAGDDLMQAKTRTAQCMTMGSCRVVLFVALTALIGAGAQ